jgi:hypothetical protein
MKTPVLYSLVFLTKIGDSLSTYMVLSQRGGYETNPFMATLMSINPLLFYLVLPFTFTAMIILLDRLFNYTTAKAKVKYSQTILYMVIFLMSAVVANNLWVYHLMTQN